ncbi:MAG: baseplate J/gp47 family protein [Clostridia bacterium]|jgi:uncharacterized phage protein gp47/JayE|nr:baseplate J/gp47 family protein [Clostridia bacterium]
MEIDNIREIEDLDEYFEYDIILQRMLDRVPIQIDKREGSIIYNALAPAAAELAQMYILLKSNIDLVFADTAVEKYLDKLANQVGLTRNEATYAIKKGLFYDENNTLIDISIGERFTIEDLVYKVVEKIETGIYKMECETVGTIGNNYVGTLIPVNYIENLAKAELTKVLIPGEEKEDDDSLRARYYEITSEQGFGGNIIDYQNRTKEIAGVGAVKVIPIWNGPGTVKLTILDSNYNKASDVLIEKVQNEICPNLSNEGLGIAPIGHIVTVNTVTEVDISIITHVTTSETASMYNLKEQIAEVINDYFLQLKRGWENSDSIIIRKAQIDTIILNADAIIDVSNTTINNKTSNIELQKFEIPILKEVTFI